MTNQHNDITQSIPTRFKNGNSFIEILISLFIISTILFGFLNEQYQIQRHITHVEKRINQWFIQSRTFEKKYTWHEETP